MSYRETDVFLRGEEVLYRRLTVEDVDPFGNILPRRLGLQVSLGRSSIDATGEATARKPTNGLATITVSQARGIAYGSVTTDIADSPNPSNWPHIMIVFLSGDAPGVGLPSDVEEVKRLLAAKMTIIRQPTK